MDPFKKLEIPSNDRRVFRSMVIGRVGRNRERGNDRRECDGWPIREGGIAVPERGGEGGGSFRVAVMSERVNFDE